MVAQRTPNYKLILTEFDRRGWQDEFYANMRTIDAALSAIVSIADFVGVWDNDVEYTIGQKVVDGDISIIYEALTNHTSSSTGTFSEERGNHPDRWTAWSQPARSRGAWVGPSTAYAAGDFVSNAATGQYAVATQNHTSTASFTDDVTSGYWDVLITAVANPMSDDTPADVAAVGAAGASSLSSRGDHVHAHGNQAGGGLHAVVIAGGAAGFMSGTDKTNLNGLVANPLDFIAANGIANSDIVQMAAATIKGRASGAGTGDQTDLTATQVGAILGPGIAAQTQKTTLVAADKLLLADSAASDAAKYATVSAIQHAVRLATANPSGVASVEFTSLMDSSLYSHYDLVIDYLLPATDNVSLVVTVSVNNGSAYISTGTYQYSRVITDASTVTAGGANNGTEFTLAAGIGNASGEGASGRLTLIAGTAHFRYVGALHINTTDGTERANHVTGAIAQASVNAIKIAMSSGNLTATAIHLIGFRK